MVVLSIEVPPSVQSCLFHFLPVLYSRILPSIEVDVWFAATTLSSFSCRSFWHCTHASYSNATWSCSFAILVVGGALVSDLPSKNLSKSFDLNMMSGLSHLLASTHTNFHNSFE